MPLDQTTAGKNQEEQKHCVVQRQYPESSPHVEPAVIVARDFVSSNIPVIRNPESTKNKFTPTQPGKVKATKTLGMPESPLIP